TRRSQIRPMRINAPISTSAAVPRVATARKASAGDKECIVASQFHEAPRPRGKFTCVRNVSLWRAEPVGAGLPSLYREPVLARRAGKRTLQDPVGRRAICGHFAVPNEKRCGATKPTFSASGRAEIGRAHV